MGVEADKLALEVEPQIRQWIGDQLDSVKGLAVGGSGAILLLKHKDGHEACLKLIRCNLATHAAEHVKLCREASYLFRSCRAGETQPHVIPVLNKHLEPFPSGRYGEIAAKLDELTGAIGKLSSEEFPSSLKKLVANLNDCVCVVEHGDHTHLGILTSTGFPLERMLRYVAQRVSGSPDIEVPTWIRDFAEVEVAGEPVVRSNLLLQRLTEDLLEGVLDVHRGGLVHLDIKEENVLALPPTVAKDCPRFVLFDFGSAQEIDPNKRLPQFEATYHYLPLVLQRQKSMSQFTSHLRAPIEFSKLDELKITAPEIDLHAVSCIIHNFLTDNRYRRISANLDDEDFENAYALAQILSIDYRDLDADALSRTGGDIAQKALERYRSAQELRRNLPVSVKPAALRHPASILREETLKELETLKPTNVDDPAFREKLWQARLPTARQSLRPSLPSGHVDFSGLLDVRLVKRLAGIRQLALTYSKPPDQVPWYAQHNRLDHVIGTMEVANLFLTALLKQSGWFRLRAPPQTC